jgi:hypothetical protein
MMKSKTLALAGKKEEAIKATALGSDFAKYSSQLIVLLTKWQANVE